MEPDEPTGPIYALMGEPANYVKWQHAVGETEAERKIFEEIEQAIDADGIRVVLWYRQRILDLGAVMEEWT